MQKVKDLTWEKKKGANKYQKQLLQLMAVAGTEYVSAIFLEHSKTQWKFTTHAWTSLTNQIDHLEIYQNATFFYNCLMLLWPWHKVKVTGSCINGQNSMRTTITKSLTYNLLIIWWTGIYIIYMSAIILSFCPVKCQPGTGHYVHWLTFFMRVKNGCAQ